MVQNSNIQQPIRVLQVLTIMNRGGAESMIMNYYRTVDRTKVQFDFLLHRKEKGAFDDEIKQLGGKIYRLNSISFRNIVAYKKSLNRFFKEHQDYKIVHAHLNALSVFVLKAAYRNKIPVRIAHSHTSLYKVNLNPFSKDRNTLSFIFKFFAQNMLKRVLPKYANFYYSCGHKAARWLFGDKRINEVKIINNAINSELFKYDKLKAVKYKNELQLNDKLIIGHVGNFVTEKNHSFLIDIFYELRKLKNNCCLILVGGGNISQYVEKVKALKIENDVHFLGVRDDVDGLLQAMDIFLFPSTNEGLPVTLIEAQASGLKIIASNEVSAEIDITGLISFLSLNQPPGEWAEKILSLPIENRSITTNKIIDGGYDIKINASKLQAFYCAKQITD